MVEFLITIPIMILTGILQATLFSRIQLLHGSADIIMLIIIAWSLNPHTKYSVLWFLSGALVMTYISALPLYSYFVIYGIIWLFILFLKSRFWQMPIILMLFVTIFGSILSAFVSFAALYLSDIILDMKTILTQIAVPSLTLNLLLAVPVFGLLNDWANSITVKEDAA